MDALRRTNAVAWAFGDVLRRSVRQVNGWDTSKYGPGILDAAKVLQTALPPAPPAPLQAPALSPCQANLEGLATVFDEAPNPRRRIAALLRAANDDPCEVSMVADEIAFLYATDDRVREAMDRIARRNEPGGRDLRRARDALRARDISSSLRTGAGTILMGGDMRALGLLALVVCVGGTSARGTVNQPRSAQRTYARSSPEGPQPGRTSPLAVNETALYSVAEDGHSILTRPADLSAPWRVLVKIPGRAGGLAVTPHGLYPADRAAAAILRIDEETSVVRVFHAGHPLADPTELAFGATSLYMADSGKSAVFQVDPREGRAELTEVDLPSRPEPGGRIFLAGSPNGVLVAIPHLPTSTTSPGRRDPGW